MTPSETQDGRGTDKTQEVEAPNSAATVSTANRSDSAEQQDANGHGEATEKTIKTVAVDEEASAPPPWQ
ncbi:hypothetical protein ACFQ1S_28920, partial [Kibdelosporangium lantanae]